MSLEAGIYALLHGNGAIVAIVADRIYPDRLPQGAALPAIVYTKISDISPKIINGRANLSQTRVQLDLFSTSHDAVKTLRDTIRDQLEATAQTAGGVEFQRINYITDQDDYDQELNFFRVIIDLGLWYNN